MFYWPDGRIQYKVSRTREHFWLLILGEYSTFFSCGMFLHAVPSHSSVCFQKIQRQKCSHIGPKKPRHTQFQPKSPLTLDNVGTNMVFCFCSESSKFSCYVAWGGISAPVKIPWFELFKVALSNSLQELIEVFQKVGRMRLEGVGRFPQRWIKSWRP